LAERAKPTAAAGEKPGEPDRAPRSSQTDTTSGSTVLDAMSAVLGATRALLWVKAPADAAAVARDLVEVLGGRVIPAAEATGDALPVDLSFGVGQPVLPSAPRSGVARMLLERHLPTFVRDAQRALELVDQSSRLAEDAAIDSLTGLANRRMLGRALGRLGPDNTVIMIDLDHFKAVNDSLGHDQGDKVLRLLGRTLIATVRAADRAGRYGGEEFVVILDEGDDADVFLARLRREWEKARPLPVTFSAGVAPARPDPKKALVAADRAMYRAKQLGRNRWQRATMEDYQ
jgi:diguanylate cyclase (GGDEF)-like protein